MTILGKRVFLSSLTVGLLAGLVVATVATLLDWRLNPGGIFHDAAGTNWAVVAETAMSWFLPVALLVAAVALDQWRRRSQNRG